MTVNIEAVLRAHEARQEKEKELAGSAWNSDRLVFCSTVGSYLEPVRVTRYLDRFLQMAGIEHISFHALRHTFATRQFAHDPF